MFLLLLILLVLLLAGSGPWYPYSRGWGYSPFGLVLLVLLVYLCLSLAGLFGPRWVVMG